MELTSKQDEMSNDNNHVFMEKLISKDSTEKYKKFEDSVNTKSIGIQLKIPKFIRNLKLNVSLK